MQLVQRWCIYVQLLPLSVKSAGARCIPDAAYYTTILYAIVSRPSWKAPERRSIKMIARHFRDKLIDLNTV